MPFGPRNAAQTLQRFISDVIQSLSFCFAYLNDLLVASKDPEEEKTH